MRSCKKHKNEEMLGRERWVRGEGKPHEIEIGLFGVHVGEDIGMFKGNNGARASVCGDNGRLQASPHLFPKVHCLADKTNTNQV